MSEPDPEGLYDVLSKGAQVYDKHGYAACVYAADPDDGLAWARTCFGHLPELSVRRREACPVCGADDPENCDHDSRIEKGDDSDGPEPLTRREAEG